MKIADIYWSGTGNMEAMADAVAKGAKAASADVFRILEGNIPGDSVRPLCCLIAQKILLIQCRKEMR